jgi:hypothetical protein
MIAVRTLLLAAMMAALAPVAPATACAPAPACEMAASCCCPPDAPGDCCVKAAPRSAPSMALAAPDSGASLAAADLRSVSVPVRRASFAQRLMPGQPMVAASPATAGSGSRAPPAA